jgi:hypothetical protein
LGGAPKQIRSGSLSKSSTHPRFPASIGWTHYLVLLRITNPAARAFYELEATRERWTVPQLERQIPTSDRASFKGTRVRAARPGSRVRYRGVARRRGHLHDIRRWAGDRRSIRDVCRQASAKVDLQDIIDGTSSPPAGDPAQASISRASGCSLMGR